LVVGGIRTGYFGSFFAAFAYTVQRLVCGEDLSAERHYERSRCNHFHGVRFYRLGSPRREYKWCVQSVYNVYYA
jgi:hypothetical protein